MPRVNQKRTTSARLIVFEQIDSGGEARRKACMLFVLAVFLSLVLDQILATSALRARAIVLGERIRRLVPKQAAPIALFALVALFAFQLSDIARAAAILTTTKPWIGHLPIAVTYAPSYPANLVPELYRSTFVIISVLQSIGLAVFLLATYARSWYRTDTVFSVIAACIMTIVAVASRTMTSADMYAYVADALLGARSAYSPPNVPLPIQYAVIHQMWGLPLLPAAYGPIWLWFNSAVLALGSSLYAKLILLRLINVVALATILVALRRLKVMPCLIAATAANPAIAMYYISSGHNELVVVALLLTSLALAGRSAVLGGIVAGIAASIKLTFLLPAAAGAVVITAFNRRFTFVIVMAVTAATVAAVLGGRPYYQALVAVAAKYASFEHTPGLLVPHVVLALMAIWFTALAVMRKRTWNSASLTYTSLAQAFNPSYVIWGMSYAVARNNSLATLLVAFPIATAMLEELRSQYFGSAVLLTLCAAVICALVLAIRYRSNPVV